MLSTILREDVETYADSLLQNSPLLSQAWAGALSPAAVGYYLDGLRYITRESTRLLLLAANQARSLGHFELEAHFRHKAEEEIGHDRWAEADLRRLESDFKIHLSREQSPALVRLILFLTETILERPICFMAYVFLVEHITVKLGPHWMAALEGKCGISRSHLSVVHNHVELDVDHVTEELAEIDMHATEADEASMRDTIREASRLIDDFFTEVIQHSSQQKRRAVDRFHATPGQP